MPACSNARVTPISAMQPPLPPLAMTATRLPSSAATRRGLSDANTWLSTVSGRSITGSGSVARRRRRRNAMSAVAPAWARNWLIRSSARFRFVRVDRVEHRRLQPLSVGS
jgi:hypothetical protein